MTVNATDLPRAFHVTTNAGQCAICAAGLEQGERAFYGVVRRDPSGAPLWTGEGQVAPKDARTMVRPEGCTCRGRKAHGARCALSKACSCPTRRGRGRATYVAHGRRCPNAIAFGDLYRTLPGFLDHAVHVGCAAGVGMTVPTGEVTTYGARDKGRLSTGEVAVEAAPVVAAEPEDVAARVAARRAAARETERQAVARRRAAADRMAAAAVAAAREREAVEAARLAAIQEGTVALCHSAPYCSCCTREMVAAGRERALQQRAAAAREAEAAKIAEAQEALNRQWGIGQEDPAVARFRGIVAEEGQVTGGALVNALPDDPGVARFRGLDLD